MRRAAIGLSICALFLSAGCTALSDKWQTTVREDKARGEKPVRYQEAINAYLSQTLKDPFSAQQKDLTQPVEAVHRKFTVVQAPTLVNTHGQQLEERRWSWLVTVQVNAKNSYGGYIGWRPYRFYFQGETLIATDGAT